MVTKTKDSFYAVARGRKTGVFTTWSECQAQTQGYAAATFKKFDNRRDAVKFIEQMSEGWSGSASNGSASISPKRQTVSVEEETEQDSKKRKVSTTDQLTASMSSGSTSDVRVIDVYTDGASSSNGQEGARAGWGVHFPEGATDKTSDLHGLDESARLPGHLQTNNRAELMAIIRAIQICPDDEAQLRIHSDSMYCIQAMNHWVPGWRRKRWMRTPNEGVKNRDLVRLLDKLLRERRHRPELIYVKGHSTDKGNIEADRLAVAGAKLDDIPQDMWEDLEPEASDVESATVKSKQSQLAKFGFTSGTQKA